MMVLKKMSMASHSTRTNRKTTQNKTQLPIPKPTFKISTKRRVLAKATRKTLVSTINRSAWTARWLTKITKPAQRKLEESQYCPFFRHRIQLTKLMKLMSLTAWSRQLTFLFFWRRKVARVICRQSKRLQLRLTSTTKVILIIQRILALKITVTNEITKMSSCSKMTTMLCRLILMTLTSKRFKTSQLPQILRLNGPCRWRLIRQKSRNKLTNHRRKNSSMNHKSKKNTTMAMTMTTLFTCPPSNRVTNYLYKQWKELPLRQGWTLNEQQRWH
mmetsp:Transcript_15943/g.33003  ORF Transcript_15943/g.33003 Transcript_15943/m.33003 type:complete len:273 (-) Transcript_15943:571-1389(-)